MHLFRMSTAAWRTVICVLAFFAAILASDEIIHSIKSFMDGERGGLGFSFVWGDTGRRVHPILSLAQDSPLLAIGARVGDTVILDDYKDDFLNLRPGQPVGLTLVHGGVASHAVVNAVGLPMSAMYKVHYVLGHVERLLCLVFAVLIAFKQLSSKAYRSLALYFVLSGFNSRPIFTPPGPVSELAEVIYWLSFIPFTYFLMRFSILYPVDQPVSLRRKLARGLPAFGALSAFLAVYMAWWSLDHPAPGAYLVSLPFISLLTCIVLIALWDGWRSSAGPDRQRHAWLLFAFGGSIFFELLTGLPITVQIDGVRVTTLLSHAATMLMVIGIPYAVLKHRVFNFGFVINRALFYSVSSLTLLITFGIVEWLSEHFLHFEAREANVLIDGAIALAVYLVFHKIRHTFEHGLERLFFRQWHQNEAQLRKFTRKAAHITTSGALIDAFHAELQRFTGGAGAWIYQKTAASDFACMDTTGKSAQTIGIDDDLVVTLRAEQVATVVSDAHPAHARQLALPMAYRGELNGFVLLGTKPNGEDYRPDEIAALALAARQVGFDLHALQIDILSLALNDQRRRADLDAIRIEEQQATIAVLQGALGVRSAV